MAKIKSYDHNKKLGRKRNTDEEHNPYFVTFSKNSLSFRCLCII